MKKILTLFLVVCMLLSVVPMTVSATDNMVTPTTPTGTTLYITNSGNDTTGDGTFNNPYATFEKAYGALSATGGSIVLKDDAMAFNDHTSTDKILDKCSGAVYVYGIYNAEEKSYPSLDFSYTSGSGATVMYLGTAITFYNLTIAHTGGNLWICGAFHDLTFGFNITTDISGNFNCALTGGYHANRAPKANSDKSCKVTIYSGEFGDCYVGHFGDVSIEARFVTGDSEFNLYGGSVKGIYGYRKSDDAGDADFNANLTINIYGGTVRGNVSAREAIITDGKTATLNFYNGATASVDGIFAESATTKGTVNKNLTKELSIPDWYNAAAYAGVQNSEINNNETAENTSDDTYNVRFVGTVDSLSFDKVGFEIDANGADYTTECTKVYTSVQGDSKSYSAAELGGNYIFAVAITGIPTSVGAVTFNVRPFIEVGGVTYYGAGYTVTYNAGVYGTSVAN